MVNECIRKQALEELNKNINKDGSEKLKGRRLEDFFNYIESEYVNNQIELYRKYNDFKYLKDIYETYKVKFYNSGKRDIETSSITLYLYSLGIDILDTNIEVLDNYYFYNINFLKEVYIPASVKQIYLWVFKHSPIEKIIVDPNNKVYDSRDNCNCIIETKTNKIVRGSLNSTIPQGIKTIGSAAFSQLGNVSKIQMKIEIPNSVKVIEEDAFFMSNITELIISDSVVSILDAAFLDCDNLEKITFGDNIKELGALCFGRCESLKEIELPSKITNVQYGSFFGCKKLEKVKLGTNLKSIDASAFHNCKSLKEIIIPSGVKSIGECAFRNCGQLEKIYLPSPLIEIGSDAFDMAGCEVKNGLVIYYDGTKEELEKIIDETLSLKDHKVVCLKD